MKPHITIFWGGNDTERSVSKKSFEEVYGVIDLSRFEVDSIEVKQDGSWFINDAAIAIETALITTDYAFIAMREAYGRDGTLQKILDEYRIPYNGSDALTTHIGFMKSATKALYQKHNIKTPIYETHSLDPGHQNTKSLADYLFKNFPLPFVLKPDRCDLSNHTHIVENFNQIEDALTEIERSCKRVLVEQYVKGRVASVGVLENLRDQQYYALPETEIVRTHNMSDSTVGHPEEHETLCPGSFDQTTKALLAELAIKAHQSIGASGYSMTDFIVTPKHAYALGTDTLPDLSQNALIRKQFDVVGLDLKQFVAHCIEEALTQR